MYSLPNSVKKFVKVNLKKGVDPKEIIGSLVQQGYTYPYLSSVLGIKVPEASKLYKDSNYFQALASPSILSNPNEFDLSILEDRRATVIRIDNFLSIEECKATIQAANKFLNPSKVTDSSIDKSYRTSTTAGFLGTESDDVASVDHKIVKMMGMNIPVFSEIIQIQKYEVGQEYKSHYDYFSLGTDVYKREGQVKGQRSWTCMIYLNDVEQGGETEFSALRLKIKPKFGTAIIWNNLDNQGMPNKRTIHKANPVLDGNKYIITKWFRDR
ncbi:prolyl hydroxylase family protein [Agaribacter flavus]|uniref:Prolyl hydroxylase family protein n=1 Tax=Agaribacter flavus TaxID=1902781 RepID=A0ABV7FNN8_9ALTE